MKEGKEKEKDMVEVVESEEGEDGGKSGGKSSGKDMSGAASASTVGGTTTRGSGIRFLFMTK